MNRLLLALISWLFASTAYAGPLIYAFYQGGYTDNAYVFGYVVANDPTNSGIIGVYNERGPLPCSLPPEFGYGPCGFDYHMRFSGNSLVPAFRHDGVDSFHVGSGGDVDDALGFSFYPGITEVPTGHYLPFGCDTDQTCVEFPHGWIASQNATFVPDTSETIDRGVKWMGGRYGPNDCGDDFGGNNDQRALCGTIRDYDHGMDTTNDRVRVWRIPEPSPLALIGIALIGLAFTRRLKQ